MMKHRAACALPVAVLLAAAVIAPAIAHAQPADATATPRPAQPLTVCRHPIPEPAALPPGGSGPVVYLLELCFDTQGNVSSVDPQSYLYYVQLKPSRPSIGAWVAYDAAVLETVRNDFRRLWATGFLDDLIIEANDFTFANGVIGKVITYRLEERARVKIVTYDGTNALDRSKLDEVLRDRGVQLKLDSFLDRGALARVATAVRELLSDKGYVDATVSHDITPVAGSPKLVNVTFNVTDGPRTAIRDVAFDGNRDIDDATLARNLKANRPQGLLSIVSGAGRYQDAKYAEDAASVEDYYRDHGYINASVGQAELRPLDDSPDGRTRYVQMRVPVREGARHKVGSIAFAGHTLVGTEALRSTLKLQTGQWYREGAVREAIRKAQEMYGAGGYIEFTAFPELTPAPPDPADRSAAPRVDLVLRITEGPQYFVNRLTFVGNTTTQDTVVRREFGLYEGGAFNTELLTYSVKRLNQLGYFKPIEDVGKDVQIDKTTARANGVDVTVKVSEQNRNAIQFGAGMSQYEGVFGNVAFTTTNFLGRGESVSLQAQKGARSSIYQLGVSEPYMFGRPISTGIELYSRKYDYLTGLDTVGYSEVRSGIGLQVGRPLFRFSRAGLSYGVEVVDTSISKSLLEGLSSAAGVGVPLFDIYRDSGRTTESRITPSFTYNTVDNPMFPMSGRRLTISAPIAGGILGGSIQYIKPDVEIVQYVRVSRRMALGARLSGGYLRPYGTTDSLPYYLRYFLGGEYQIRGVDIRTVGPTDGQNRALGGNKFVLFNAEYYLNIAGPLRAVLFHDAGQAFEEADPIDVRRLRTSSGIEFRMVVPMLNVPFRVIYAWNVYRDTFQPARALKFSVGTTF